MPTAPESPAGERRSAARERLLATASKVFYEEGINAVSVDQVIDAASVTRSTFYRHFPGKDDLVAACLTDRDEQIRAAYAGAAEHEQDPAELLRLMMHAIGDELCGAGFRGCPFINAAAEFPDPDSLPNKAVVAHRSWFRAMVIDLLSRAGVAAPKKAARTMVMLRDGAMVGGYLEDSKATRRALVEAVDTVLATHPRAAGR
jgi:AcrR family transcriptional regulator